MAKTDLTAERLREVLNYDPETGVFTWKIRSSRRSHIGSIAGTKEVLGYWCIEFEGGRYKGHRLAWLYIYGKWPLLQVDHINGVRCDNRISNLREATRAENQQNRKITEGGGQFSKGTHCNKRTGRWEASISVDGTRLHLGTFDTQEEAHKAYVAAKLVHHTFSPVAYSQK